MSHNIIQRYGFGYLFVRLLF